MCPRLAWLVSGLLRARWCGLMLRWRGTSCRSSASGPGVGPGVHVTAPRKALVLSYRSFTLKKKKKLHEKGRALCVCRQDTWDSENGQVVFVSHPLCGRRCGDSLLLTGCLCCRKFEQAKSFGVVTSSGANIVWTPNGRPGTGAGEAIVAANEEVLRWDIKKGELLGRWTDEKCKAQVTAIAQSKTDKDVVAVGIRGREHPAMG